MILPKPWIKAALVGTDSAPITHGDWPARVPLVAHQDDTSDPAQLLLSAGITGIWRQAGECPPQILGTSASPCATDARSVISTQASKHLQIILSEKIKGILPEWLRALKAANKRLPDELIPKLLDYGSCVVGYRPLILDVLSERGIWLYEQTGRERWTWIDEYTMYDHLVQEQPLALTRSSLNHIAMQQLRHRDPDYARELLQAQWSSLSTRLQRQLLLTLNINLSLNDEPYLESLLNNAEVRDFAARLLASMAQSRFSQEAHERAPHFVTMEQCYKDAPPMMCFVWSGETPETRKQIMRSHAESWLTICDVRWLPRKIISYVHPQFWCDHFNLTRHELIAAVRRGPSTNTFLDALAWSASTCGDDECAFLLMSETRSGEIGDFLRRRLIEVLTPQQCEAVAQHWFARMEDGFYIGHPAMQMIQHMDTVWSETLSHQFIEIVRTAFSKQHKPIKHKILYRLLQVAADRIAPSTFDVMCDALEEIAHDSERQDLKTLDGVHALVAFRVAMLDAIQADDA